MPIRGADRLADALVAYHDQALLFRTLATLRTDAPVFQDVDELRWLGPTPHFEQVAEGLGAPQLWNRARSVRRGDSR